MTMQTVEVRFKGNRRGFFDWAVGSAPLRLNEAVLVEAERGLDLGRVNSAGEAALAKCGGCTSCETSPATGVEGRGSSVSLDAPLDSPLRGSAEVTGADAEIPSGGPKARVETHVGRSFAGPGPAMSPSTKNCVAMKTMSGDK
jgi:hypothetical protein